MEEKSFPCTSFFLIFNFFFFWFKSVIALAGPKWHATKNAPTRIRDILHIFKKTNAAVLVITQYEM